jgi:hypothetical protein
MKNMKSGPARLILLLTVCSFLASLLLSACGDAPTPTTSPITEVQANALLLGSQDNSWGQISRYEGGGQLEDIKLTDENRNSLSSVFQYASGLAAVGTVASNSISSNAYKLVLKPEISKGLADGSLKYMTSLEGKMLPVVVDNKGVIRGLASLKSVGAGGALLAGGPAIIATTLIVVASAQFMEGINQQLQSIDKKVDAIKAMLNDQQRANLEGNMKYLQDWAAMLDNQKIPLSEIDVLRNQLETVEREILQVTYLMRDKMKTSDQDFQTKKMDKMLGFINNDDKARELGNLLKEHQQYATNYLNAISIRGLASQIRSAFPESRNIATTRLEDARNELANWNQLQTAFYDEVDKQVNKIGGLFSDDKLKTAMLAEAKTGRQDATQNFNRLDGLFSSTLDKVKAQSQNSGQPVTLVVTLDQNGKIVKTSKLNG